MEFNTFRKNDLPNSIYLQKFKNLVYIESSLDGNLHDDYISKIISLRDYNLYNPRDYSLSDTNKIDIKEKYKDL